MNSKKKYNRENRDPLYVSYLLKTKGITQADVARDLGITRQSVNDTLRGKSNSQKILDHIRSLKVPGKYLGAIRA